MRLSNFKKIKNDISIVFDEFNNVENYFASLYLHKSEIVIDEENDEQRLKIVLDKPNKDAKLEKAMFNTPYGSYIITFLNADFSTAEKAYYTFFIYYGLEGLEDIDNIVRKYPIEYSSRYDSTKAFENYYNKVYEFVKEKYIKFQNDLRETVDFVYKIRFKGIDVSTDKYARFVAYSQYIDLIAQFKTTVTFRIMSFNSKEDSKPKNKKDVETLAYKIEHKRSRLGIMYLYRTTSHLALAYVALTELIKNAKKNISVCQNCGRYYIQNSGKEIYCDLFNLDGSPTCRNSASKRAYDLKIEEDIAELTYKRENQRRMTQIYRAKEKEKAILRAEYLKWKKSARENLVSYREDKIPMSQFIEWIENSKGFNKED